jgi:hypothetical protein
MTRSKALQNETASALRAVVHATRKQVARQERGAIAEQKFFTSLGHIISSESPSFKSQFDALSPWFTSSAAACEGFRAAESRSIEDLNDCAERFVTVIRIADARTAALTKCKSARSKLASAKAELSAKLHKDEATIYEAKRKVDRRIDKLAGLLKAVEYLDQEFISARGRYDAFRHRRTQQSYVHLGDGMAQYKQAEVDAWKHIEEIVLALQAGKAPVNVEPELETPAPVAEVLEEPS